VEGQGEMVHYASLSKGIVSISNAGTYTLYDHAGPIFFDAVERNGITITSGLQRISNKESASLLVELNKKNRSVPIYRSTSKGNWGFTELSYTENKNALFVDAFYLGGQEYVINGRLLASHVPSNHVLRNHLFFRA